MGKCILLVDGNKYFLEAFRMGLSAHTTDCTILTAASGETAAGILRRVPVDVIIADVAKPVSDDLAFIRNAKAGNPSLAVIALAHLPIPCLAEDLVSAGFSRFIEKTFDIEQLCLSLVDFLI